MLSPELVDFLNRGDDSTQSDWLSRNPVLGNFVTCPVINIRPTVIPHARRISAFERMSGRDVHIEYNDGSHRHILEVSERTTVDSIIELIQQIEDAGGSCHVERSFLIFFIPAGYYLSQSKQGKITLVRDLDGTIRWP